MGCFGVVVTGVFTWPGQEIFVLCLTLDEGWVRVEGSALAKSIMWDF